MLAAVAINPVFSVKVSCLLLQLMVEPIRMMWIDPMNSKGFIIPGIIFDPYVLLVPVRREYPIVEDLIKFVQRSSLTFLLAVQ